jgi:hypothetical protein
MRRVLLFCSLFCISSAISKVNAQLFQQTFNGAALSPIFTSSTSTPVSITNSDYYSNSGGANKFSSISCGGGNSFTVDINSTLAGEFVVTDGANGFFNLSRSADIASPAPTAIKITFNAKFDVTSTGAAGRFFFQVGSGFSDTWSSTIGNMKEADANVFAGIVFRSNNGTNGATIFQNNNTTQIGATNIGESYNTWTLVANNSGSQFSYTSPSGSTETVADNAFDLWIGTTRWGNDIAASNNSAGLTDFKFATLSNSSAGRISIFLQDFRIDDISPSSGTPTITVGSITAFGNQVANTPSGEKTYNVSGSSLTNDITITPPSGYEISTGTGGGFVATNPIILAQNGGSVASTPIYVRFNPTAVQSYNGNITHTSTGADPKDVAVSGSGVAPSAPTSLSISHRSDNIQRLTWTAPTGSYDQVLIFARSAGDVTHAPSGAGSAYNNANSVFGNGGAYSTDNRLVYAGTGTNVEITGLSNSTTYYYQAFAYSGSTYSTAASLNGATAVQPTTSLNASIASQQSGLTWTNPTFSGTQTNYWDEVLVLAKSGSAVNEAPTGDASSYTANAIFGTGTDIGSGNFVVYKGTGTGVTVTGLTNGTTYHYATFVRHGTVWSASQTSSATPNISSNATDEFRSKASGNWNAVTPGDVWQSFTNGSWIDATLTPGTSAASITIRTGHTITVPNGASISADDITVEAPTSNVSNDHGRIEIASGGTLTIANGAASTDMTVNGYVKNLGTLTLTGAATVSGSNAVYEHNVNSVTIPGFIWAAGSKLLLTGTFSTASANSAGTLTTLSYQNIEVNCNLQNLDAYFVLGAQTIAGTLTITGTGNGAVLSTTGSAFTCNAFAMTSGNFYVNRQAGGTRALVVIGNANITGGTLYVKINASSTQTNSLGQFSVGGDLTIGASATVSNGALAGQTASTTQPQIIFNGTTNQTLTVNSNLSGAIEVVVNKASGTLQLNTNFTSTGTFTLTSGSVEVAAGKRLTLSGGGDFNSNSVTLKSNATGTAALGQITGTLFDATNITVERFVPSKASRKWTYIASPVSGISIRNGWQDDVFITGAGTGGTVCATNNTRYNSNGFDASGSNAPSMYTYNVTQVNGSRWVSVANTTSTNLVPGTGYRMILRGQRSDGTCVDQLTSQTPAAPTDVVLSASGTLTQGPVNVPIYGKTAYNANGGSGNAYTLIGNPYASEVSLQTFYTANIGKITSSFWFYAPSNNSSTFSTYNANTNQSADFPSGYSNGNGVTDVILASGQAFFVERSDNADDNVTFTESQKSVTATPGNTFYRTQHTLTDVVKVKFINLNNAEAKTEIFINYFAGAGTSNTDITNFDSYSFNTGNAHYLASIKSGKLMAIQTKAAFNSNDTVQLAVKGAVGNHKLIFSDYQNFTSANTIQLIDSYANTVTDIRSTQEYSFSINSNAASQGNNRFKIVFKSSAPLPVTYINLTAESASTNVKLNWTVGGEQNMNNYVVERSADGTSFSSIGSVKATGNNNNQVSYSLVDAQPLENVSFYRIKAVDNNGSSKYSVIIKLNRGKSSLVHVYPNPVKEQLNIVTPATGKYDLRIINMYGRVVHQQNTSAQNGIITVDAKQLIAGSYVLQLVDSKGNITTESFIKL